MEIGILIMAFSFGTVSLAVACVCFYKHHRTRELLEFTYSELEELENILTTNKETLEAVNQRAVDQSRRVAWLETRVRQPKLARKDGLAETPIGEKPNVAQPLSIAERRQRVLSLANSGRRVEMIAETLGMLTGEVELIINLNRASYAKAA